VTQFVGVRLVKPGQYKATLVVMHGASSEAQPGEGAKKKHAENLGLFSTAADAALAYDRAARAAGKTKVNFPREGTSEVKAVHRERGPRRGAAEGPAPGAPLPPPLVGNPTLDAQRSALQAADRQMAARAAAAKVSGGKAGPPGRPVPAPAAALPPRTAQLSASTSPPPVPAAPVPPPVLSPGDELPEALRRHGLHAAAAACAAERIDATLLRQCGAGMLRGQEVLRRLGVPDTLGDRLHLALALQELGVRDAMLVASLTLE